MSTKIRVRFAPSPTGHLHLGSVRTALFNWLFARHTGGAYLLRIEDTDIARSKKEYVDSQLASLKWLGLMPDEELVFQMSYQDRHKKELAHLLDQRLAYPCFCAPGAQLGEQEYRKIGADKQLSCSCREKRWSEQELAKPHALRFRVPDDLTRVVFDDIIRGPIIFPRDQLDDFIIRRQDGTPTYNFCVVADDIAMGITHVIRGEDHISNTPKQILLYQAFQSKQLPRFAHLPLILGPSGNRLSKREVAVSVDEYRAQGFCADALFNYLVRLGWSHKDQEIFTKQELIKLFTLKNVNKTGAIFDVKKLTWLNGVYIRESSAQELLEMIEQMSAGASEKMKQLWPKEQLNELIDLYKQRSDTLLVLFDSLSSLHKEGVFHNTQYLAKMKDENIVPRLKVCAEALDQLGDDMSAEQVATSLKIVAKDLDLKIVDLAQPMRFALTGSPDGPGVFALVSILGKAPSIGRIKRLIDELA